MPNEEGLIPIEFLDPPPVYPSWYIPLDVVIQVVGSRGDVQRFVGLGNELQRHGHRVRLATHAVFEQFVLQAGLEFFAIGGDPAQLVAVCTSLLRWLSLLTSMAVHGQEPGLNLGHEDVERRRNPTEASYDR